MSKLQASAKMKVPQDKLQVFKKVAEEYIKQVKDKDAGTLQCDWFLRSDLYN